MHPLNVKKEYIYVLKNPAIPGKVKLGITDNPNRRLKELSAATGVPEPFYFYFVGNKENVGHIEREAHFIFDDYRDNKKKEFLSIDPERLVRFLKSVGVADVTLEFISNFVIAKKAEKIKEMPVINDLPKNLSASPEEKQSRYRGVHWHPRANRWQVYVKHQYVGVFTDEETAAKAYDTKAKEIYGDLAVLNFPK